MLDSQPQGFLAVPAADRGSPILVLHPWWGLNETMRGFCTQLSGAGFTAFAPDLYHGQVARTIEEAEALSSRLDPGQAQADIAAAVSFLRQQAAVSDRGLAVIGFSLGAYFALELSVTAPEYVRSVVVFYGTRAGDYTPSRAAYLGHFAETDDYEPPAEVNHLEESLAAAGRPVKFYHYPATGHWFFEPDRVEAYQPAAAALAWERTLAFLRSAYL